jgi:hypothetical protein
MGLSPAASFAAQAGEAPPASAPVPALTAEAQANLPAARNIASALLPPGIYRKMMTTTFDGMMQAMTSQMSTMPLRQFLASAGVDQRDVDTASPETMSKVMQVVDPAHDERMKRVISALGDFMAEMMDKYEPAVRDGLAEAYARRFSSAQLADLARFFETPTGSAYAREAMLIQTDPAIMSRMMNMMPDMMKRAPEMGAAMEKATKGLPAPRAYKDLSQQERQHIAELLGIDPKKMKS